MIFKEKEYEILFKTLQKIGYKLSLYDIQNIFKNMISEERNSPQALKEDIDKETFKNLPISNTLNEYLEYNMKKTTLNTWLYEIDKKSFIKIQEEFEKNKIDLVLQLQEDLFTHAATANGSLNRYGGDRYTYVTYSVNYCYYMCNTNANYKDSILKEKVFNIVIENIVEMTSKQHHPYALGLIKKAIEVKEDPDKIMKWFKSFIETNKTINSSAKKEMDFIKENIKKWDLSKYFKKNEINLLYSSNDGFISKKVEGLFYEIDVNLIKAKTKSTSDTIGTNIRLLITVLDEVLGDTENYIKTTSLFNDPQVQFNILFKSGVEDNQIESMNEIVKNIINSKEKIKKNDMSEMIKIGLFTAFLEEKLETKSQLSTKKAKL